MVRKDTNKQYSLRKLKKGTASVAVALTVVGAGLASQTEVKADRYTDAHNAVTQGRTVPLRNLLLEMDKNSKLRSENEELQAGLQEKKRENEELQAGLQEKERELEDLKDAELKRLNEERHDHDKREAERKALEDKLADKQEHLDGALRYINEKEAERKEKEAEQKK
ncbi:TPA: YSIRK-type signal peptide-containing protein, partial [Streptococcus pyogenes]|nr:YSIRK-type signal peptide-containing protein [Streptococcus pyogenes]